MPTKQKMLIQNNYLKGQFENETQLPKKLQNVTSTKNNAEANWKIVGRSSPVNCVIPRYKLCLYE